MTNKVSEQGRKNIVAGAKKSAQLRKEKKKQRIQEYNSDPKRCQNCNNPIPYEKRRSTYCNSSCFAQVSNIGKQRNVTTGKRMRKPCLECRGTTTNEKFCSSSCHAKHRQEEVYQSIRDGKYTSSWGGNKVLKAFLVHDRGNKCEECLRDKWIDKDIPITIHHIDGDATNNNPSNLQLLCWNCHAITENFGKKNKKSTRDYRYSK